MNYLFSNFLFMEFQITNDCKITTSSLDWVVERKGTRNSYHGTLEQALNKVKEFGLIDDVEKLKTEILVELKTTETSARELTKNLKHPAFTKTMSPSSPRNIQK